MARISASHAAGLDLIDKLFFNQIIVQCLFTEELLWLKDLNTDLDRELTHKGVTGGQRQVVRHGVLCMLEAELSESLLRLSEIFPDKLPALPENITQYEQVQSYNLKFFQANNLAIMELMHQCDKQVVIEITNSLLGKYKNAPATVRYQLTERMFAYEFINAPIDCFTWLAKMGILDSSKYPGDRLKARYCPEFLKRLALLCEFDIQRERIRRITSQNDCTSLNLLSSEIGKHSKKNRRLILYSITKAFDVLDSSHLINSFPIVSLTELEKPNRIQHFFTSMKTHTTRVRVRAFQGSLGGWTGMLCGGFVEVLGRRSDQKSTIYSDESNEGSVTDYISKDMRDRGFIINSRTIYERHRDFKETILKIATAYYVVMKVAIPPYMDDLVYDALILQASQLKPKLRRNPSKKE